MKPKHLPPSALRGVLPVVQTPFHPNGTIDWPTLQREVDFLFQHQVDGLVVGMVSEVQRLTEAERDALHQNLVLYAQGRGPVVSSVGAESLVQAIRHARAAEAAGASAHMAIPPATTRCSAAELVGYYAGLVGATERPIIVQDASGYLGNPIPVDAQAEIYRRFPKRVMFKPEANPIGQNLTRFRQLVGSKAIVFEGTGGIALMDTYARGVQGTIPGAEVPWALVALWRALEAGDQAKARQIHACLASMVALITCLDAFLAIEKFLLVEQGIFRNTLVRGPVGFTLDAASKKEVLAIFKNLKRICGA
jgi:4-hydroxy-tetrahydrodipicolinate synthase